MIAAQLERVERGEIDRLMLHVPPRQGKSELASRRFPAFCLGRRPERQIISVSASAGLAEDFGREVRNLIDSEEYRVIFEGVSLAQDSKAKDKWHTRQGGMYYAVGIGGQLLGRGGDLILIDDPFSSMADAQSEVERKKVWDWYTGTLYNRQQPGAAIVLINHRMHEDDLSGHLLAQQAAGGDKWEVVELPAFATSEDDLLGRAPGEALWPEAYPIEALERIRRNTLPRYWSALYQQAPAPDDGTFFLRSWLKPYETSPDVRTLSIYGASDFAVSQDRGDYTVHIVLGIDPDNQIWLLDLWRGQASSDTWVEAWCDLVLRWKPLGWASEKGPIDSGVGPFLEQRSRQRKAYCAITRFPTSMGRKEIRAQSIRGRMALDGLRVPVDAPWYVDFERELLAFPAGKHDDAVDALAWFGQLLDTVVAGRDAPKQTPARMDRAYREHSDVIPSSNSILTL